MTSSGKILWRKLQEEEWEKAKSKSNRKFFSIYIKKEENGWKFLSSNCLTG
jgi:hypothetical protein